MLNMARAFNWTNEVASHICEDIESGLTLRAVAEKNGISKALILKKVASSPEFRDQYAHAMDVRTEVDCDALADEISQEPETNKFGVDSGWVAWQRLRVDTMKWLLSKRNPKKYGERIQQDISGELGIKTVLMSAPVKSEAARPEAKPAFEE